jgi:hypothetical protein
MGLSDKIKKFGSVLSVFNPALDAALENNDLLSSLENKKLSLKSLFIGKPAISDCAEYGL